MSNFLKNNLDVEKRRTKEFFAKDILTITSNDKSKKRSWQPSTEGNNQIAIWSRTDPFAKTFLTTKRGPLVGKRHEKGHY